MATVRRISPQTALRAAPNGDVLAYTDKAPVTPAFTGATVQQDGATWHAVTAYVRGDRVTNDAPFRYVPQLGPRNDPNAPEHRNSSECGLASAAMLLSTRGITADRIDRLSDKYDPDDDGTSAEDLIRMAADYGAAFVARTYDTVIPDPDTICLGRYDFMDRSKLEIPSFTGWHWVQFRHRLANGNVVIADPLYRDDRGAAVEWSMREWSRYFVPRSGSGLRIGVGYALSAQRALGAGAGEISHELLTARNDVVRLV